MNAGGWMSLGRLFPGASTRERRSRTHAQRSRKTIPSLESLEAIALLSTGSVVVRLHDSGHHLLATKHMSPGSSFSSDMNATSTSVTLPAQTLSLGSTLTNFTNLPLSPALNLFDPSLGTLISVAVSHSATIQGNITSQNLSTSSPALITASVSGSYSIDGLNEPISQPTRTVSSQPVAAGVSGSDTDTVTFPPVLLTDSSSMTFTDPTSLAFFTASSGRATITPAMTATAHASASAPNGNLFTITVTSASATVTVSYTYLPMCPTPVSIGRIGLHHQNTQLILTFSGSVNPTLAEDTSNYSVITRGGRRIAIVSATFNPTTNSVTLQPARQLNVHLHFQLSVKLPCPNAESATTVLIPFGGRSSLIGFHNHRGQFVPVQGGKIVRF